LKQRMPRLNRGSSTSCAVAFDIWSISSRHHRALPGRTRTSHGLGGVGRR
jgi:hypothetical protein